jgi:hypothetical protein
MDAQDYRNLQEAYTAVYSPQEVDEGLRSAVKRLFGGKKEAEPPKPESRGEQLRKKYNVGPEKSDTSAKRQILNRSLARAKEDQKTYGDSKYSQSVAQQSADAHDRYLKAGYSKYGASDARGSGNRARRRAAALQREEYDLYDIILSHLLDEGYAETPEAAEVIMVNMSEEWRESIITEVSKAEFDAGMKAAAIQMSRERPTYTPTPDQLDHFGQLNKNKKPLPPDKRKPGGIYADPPINTRKGSDPYRNLSVGVPIAGLN